MESSRYPLIQENTIERNRFGGAKWLVWGGIFLGSRTDLLVQSVTITGHIYRDIILEQHVRLFRGAMGAEFLFMDDNARPHRANIVEESLQSEDITCMDWPAYSSDLNPIEHVWDMLGRRIAAHQPPPTCLPELRRALLDEWCKILQDQIHNLIFSIYRRSFVAYPHRPMTLHSPTENSLAVLNHKILEANSQVQNVKLGGPQTCLLINRLWHELCDMLCRLGGTTAPGHHDCSIQE
ncbi:transposable element Tc3 transposase [Trichonephila clavipes]|uniref:Transposable element Tc3 transposase n=1 Tax=Trichonephila clavipes TaxID=2585209 RepID=A0A8X6ST44_TRICX|nr:transposable element Tc3 transposase [Trichonephila clavipes]